MTAATPDEMEYLLTPFHRIPVKLNNILPSVVILNTPTSWQVDQLLPVQELWDRVSVLFPARMKTNVERMP